jgi:phosphoglycerol transferase
MTKLKDLNVTPVNWGLIKTNPTKFWQTLAWVVPVVGLGVIWVMTRIMDVLPKILGDELIYSTNARHTALAESSVPNYLFNLVYSTTSGFGYGFYSAAKMYNIVFLIGFAAVVYFAARLIAKPGVSFVVALIALVGPISAYASYFTPEMMFYFGCAVVIYFALRFHARTGAGKWALLGVGLGLVTLVKPHALFLAAPIVAYIVYLAFKGEGNGWLKSVARVVSFAGAMLVTKFAIGYLIAGQKGLAIFGGSYDASANSALKAAGKTDPSVILDPTVAPIAGAGPAGLVTWQILFHISYMLMFFAVPLVLTGIQTVRAFKLKGEPSETTKVSFFLFVALIALVMVSAVFVAYSSAFGETLQNRVMIRYYEYLIPFLPLTLLPLGNHIPKLGKGAKWGILAGAVVWLAVALPNMSTIVPGLFTDSSMMASAIKSGIPLTVFAMFGVGMLAYWLFKPELGSSVWLFGFAPVIILFYAVSSYLNMTIPSSLVGMYTNSSHYAHNALTDAQRAHMLVIGNNLQNIQAAQLWVDSPTATGQAVPEGAEVNLNDLGEQIHYILVIGKVSVTGDGFMIKQTNNWALIKNATAAEVAAGAKK